MFQCTLYILLKLEPYKGSSSYNQKVRSGAIGPNPVKPNISKSFGLQEPI